jgi:HK97 gp10 family phage protein
MKIEMTLDVEGLKDLEAALVELGDEKVRKASARRALVKAAKPLLDDMKQNAPVARGHLERGIRIGSPGNVGAQAFASVLQSGGSRDDAVAAMRDVRRSKSGVEIAIGPGRHPQAIFQEFGTEHHAPQPFVRPAWEGGKDKALGDIKKELWADIEKTAKRAANKAARLAKKSAKLDANADLLRSRLGIG